MAECCPDVGSPQTQIPEPLECPCARFREKTWVVSRALLQWRAGQSNTRQHVRDALILQIHVCAPVPTLHHPKAPHAHLQLIQDPMPSPRNRLSCFHLLEMHLFRKCHTDGTLQYVGISSGFLHVHRDFRCSLQQ